jgi:hypothetical protein
VAWLPLLISLESSSALRVSQVHPDGEPAWWFTGVYGPQSEGEKNDFLNEL